MKNCALLLLLILLPTDGKCSYPTYLPSSEPTDEFLPAKSGETPTCVKDPRLTFCEEPEEYPKDRILYLLKNKMYDVDTFLQDETRDIYTFEARNGPSYPATMMYNTPSPRPTNMYSKPRSSYPSSGNGNSYRNPKAINFNYNQPRNYSHQYGPPNRPPKYDLPNHFKVPPYNNYPPRNNTFPLNSFPSYPSKYDTSRRANIFKAKPRYVDRNYQRYRKNGYNRARSVSYNRHPPLQNNWWGKRTRRQKRQASLEVFCPADTNYIRPRVSQSVGGDWMYLVNVNEQYTQLVKSETCRRNTCEGLCDIPEGDTAVCQQQYVQKRLVALDGSGSKLNSDTFWFPSCCLCKVRPGAG